MNRSRTYSIREEKFNAISHAAGIIIGIAGGYILFSKIFKEFDVWKTAGVGLYLLGMLSCYTVSTLYHGSRNEKKKKVLQKLDHALIYVHIAGTYSPFTLVVLRESGAWGWLLFIFIWLTAIAGTVLSFSKSLKHSNIETLCYIAMGCAILIAFKPLITALNEAGSINSLYWLISGGVSYIVGALFYSLAKIEYMHTVFHFFVLIGTLCHLTAIYIIL